MLFLYVFILQYLDFAGFQETVKVFKKECKIKGKPLPKPADVSSEDSLPLQVMHHLHLLWVRMKTEVTIHPVSCYNRELSEQILDYLKKSPGSLLPVQEPSSLGLGLGLFFSSQLQSFWTQGISFDLHYFKLLLICLKMWALLLVLTVDSGSQSC